MTQLTERQARIEEQRQAWLEIAEAYATDRINRDRKQRILALCGCCSALNNVGDISPETKVIMKNKILQCLNDSAYFIRPYGTCKGDHLRADFCYLMAYACEEE